MRAFLSPFVLYPLVANFVGGMGSFVVFPDRFAGQADTCYLIAAFGCAAALSTLIFLGLQRIDHGPTLVALIVHAVALIVLFAGIYRGFGLTPLKQHPGVMPWDDALYFSIVTRTTLGYGDFTPLPAIRLLSALQALLGYVFLGLIISLGADRLTKREAGDP